MELQKLSLRSFRSYEALELDFPSGLTAIRGPNGVGKSNLLEAIGYLSTLKSFRGVPSEALVNSHADSAVIRADVIDPQNRPALIEMEIARSARSRTQVNKVRLKRGRDLLSSLVVSVFSPDDLKLIKDGPGIRRDYLDDVLAALRRTNGEVALDWEKALKQRNALLKQIGFRARLPLGEPEATTLEVWNSKASEAGEALVAMRENLVVSMTPVVTTAYRDLSGGTDSVVLRYRRSWDGSLGTALNDGIGEDLKRGTTQRGPHRDELEVWLNELPARTSASQGEQRCLSLALRLAAHRELARVLESPPVLLLDDVFSELDPERSSALLLSLPQGQAFLSTASALPIGCSPDLELSVGDGNAIPVQ